MLDMTLVFDRVKDIQLLNSRVISLTKIPFMYLRNVQSCFADNCTNHGNSSYLAVAEKGNCSNIFINPDKLTENQKAVNRVTGLSDKTYGDINGYSNHTFSN